jgi:hypothetical protein
MTIDLADMEVNHDDKLPMYHFIQKYQLNFTEYFGPDYAFGVTGASYQSDTDELCVTARVRAPHQSTRGTHTSFNVNMGKFRVWRNNVKLYKFISDK